MQLEGKRVGCGRETLPRRAMRAPLALVALCCVARAQVVPYDGADRHKIIVHNTGSEDLGFYYLGNGYDPGPEVAMWDGSETLNAIIEPGGEAGRYVAFSDAFALRSADMRWRARFSLYAHDDDAQPYKVSFYNIMEEPEGGAMELKHHDAGYLWIEKGHHVTHTATGGHRFEVNDVDRAPRFALEVHVLDEDEV